MNCTLTRCSILIILLTGVTGLQANTTPFTLQEVLDYPFMGNLIADERHDQIAWVQNYQGVRNVWVAAGPTFTPHPVTSYDQDDGQELTQLTFAPDGRHLLYVRGGDHEANWPAADHLEPNAAARTEQQTVAIWSVDVRGGTPVRVAAGDAPVVSSGGVVAFVKEGQVWTGSLDGSLKPERLFSDRGHDRALSWSADGRRLAFVSDRGDHAFIGVLTDKDHPVRFLSPSSGSDDSPRWSPDGKSIAFVRLQPSGAQPQLPFAQTPNPWSLWVANVETGDAHPVWQGPLTSEGSFPETPGEANLHWASGNRLVFLADLDHWPHLYSVSVSGGAPLLLTPGPFVVEDVVESRDGRSLIYTANTGLAAGDDGRRHLFIVPVDHPAPRALTPGEGIESTPVVASDTHVAFIQTDARHPTSLSLMAVRGGERRTLNNPLSRTFPVEQLVVPQPVSFQAADGVKSYGQLFRVRSTTAQPGIIFLHGGPTRQMLLGWHPMEIYSDHYAVNQYLATHGYVVLSVNYRLGTGYGHAFEHPEHAGPFGAAEYADVLAATRMLQAMPGVDPRRIGIWGSSYGGYLSALALARDSDTFKAGVDIYGISDMSAFVSHDLDPPALRFEDFGRREMLKVAFAASPVAALSTWRSPVLIVHGDDDRNVPVAESIDLIERLNTARVPHEEIILPNEIHSFLLHQSSFRVDQAVVRFFGEQLKAAP